MTNIDLYSYFRSSAAFRVRIALNLKGLGANHHAVNLRDRAQHDGAYAAIHPQRLVPAVRVDGHILPQSISIMEYLDEAFPGTPQLVWGSALQRARIRALALMVACEIHPLNNLRVLDHLRNELGQDEEAIQRWCRHWMQAGLSQFERALQAEQDPALQPGQYCVKDEVSLADVVLAPQVFNAQRFKLPLDAFPQTMRRFDALMQLEAFDAAQPARQPDAC